MAEGLGLRKGSGEGYNKICNGVEARDNINNNMAKFHKRSLLIRILVFGMAVMIFRFVYVMVEEGGCDEGQRYCILDLNPLGLGKDPSKMPRHAFKSREVYIQLQVNKSVNPELQRLWTTKEWRQKVDEFSVFFQGFMDEGLLKSEAKALCVGAKGGQEVLALREIGVSDAVGIDPVPSPPLVMKGDFYQQPFEDNTFDFVFSDVFDSSEKFAAEISRTLKPGGIAILRMHETYSIDSFILLLFSNFSIVRSAKWEECAEIVLKKNVNTEKGKKGKCSVPAWKKSVMDQAEPLIETEPLKPWIALKTNVKNIKYLPTLADIGSRRNYHYVDVGARSYGSSIGSWFKKKYPKQNNTFRVYAIEADQSFYGDYQKRKGVKLLPYAAWVRNESLSFEINRDAGSGIETKGMGRIQPSSSSSSNGRAGNKSVSTVQGLDFAEWLKNTVSEDDFVVMKMDVEGTEFDLLPRLMETGAICLIDELFLECHYNRWQRCCPERTPKYQRTYGECLDLFNSLRSNGVLVHQWW